MFFINRSFFTLIMALGCFFSMKLLAVEQYSDIAQTQELDKVESVQKYEIFIAESDPILLKVIDFYSTNPNSSQADIVNFVYSNVQDPIRRVQGVGNTILFSSNNVIHIWVKPHKIAYYKLSTSDIITALHSQNAQVTAGQLGSLDVTMTEESALKNVEQYGNILIKVNTDGSNIFLKDVAKIEPSAADHNLISRYNGNTSVGFAIYLATGANQLETSNAVDERMKELALLFPKEIQYVSPHDTTLFVNKVILSKDGSF